MSASRRVIGPEPLSESAWAPFGWLPMPDTDPRDGEHIMSFTWGDPHVNITVTAFRSEPVFFVGAFRNPGLYSLQGGRTLVEMMAAVGGMQPNASRRVYFGLNSKEDPGRLPRLIITYRRKMPQIPPCATAPSELTTIQSDGRPDDTSSCNFIPRTDIPLSSSDYKLYPYEVATGTRTKTQAAYRDRLYVVQQAGAAARLEELGPLGGLIASVPIDGEVRAGSAMVVDSFGRLRIVTNTAIFTAQLGNSSNGTDLPGHIDKKPFDAQTEPGGILLSCLLGLSIMSKVTSLSIPIET